MKSLSLCALAGLIALAAASASFAQSSVEPTITINVDQKDSAPIPEREGDADWRELVQKVKTKGNDAASILQAAEAAKSFHATFPQHPHAAEAKRLEAVCLVEAVNAGSSASRPRMEATVLAVRNDQSLPASERAIVAGTYDFSEAEKRIKKFEDIPVVFEAVARALMQEFPNQPQGPVSLLTQSGMHDRTKARAMITDVLNAPAAPAEAHVKARRLLTRLDLEEQSVEQVLGAALDTGKNGWQSGQAGLVYFWATWSPDSLAFGEMLRGRKLAKFNVVGVCLDRDHAAAEAAAKERKLPGQLIYIEKGAEGDLAVKLGADEAPLLYFVNEQGQFTDARAIYDVEAKLAGFGL